MIDIFIAAGKFRAELKLNGKYNILCGPSATGKTVLRERLDGVTLAPKSSYKYEGPGRIISAAALPEHVMAERLRTSRESVFVIEEGSVFLSDRKYLKMILESPNYFIIIAREQFNRLPYGVYNIFGLRWSGDHFTAYNLVDSMPLSVAVTPHDAVLCEGSGLDYKALCAKLHKDVESAGGKDKVYASLLSKPISVLVIDWCGSGGATSEILRLCGEKGVKYFYSPSFEYELLANQWLCGEQGKQLRHLYSERMLDFRSEESFYTECVDYCLKQQLGVGYNKSSDGSLVDLVCNGKALFGKTLKEGEPQPVKMDWLYPGLKVNQTVNRLRLE